MIEYFTIAGLFWAGAFFLYLLFLQKRTFHQLNRAYLLLTLIVGACIPFLELPENQVGLIQTTFGAYLAPIIVQLNGIGLENQVQNDISNTPFYWNLIFLIYGVGVLFFIGRLLHGIFKIRQFAQHCDKKKTSAYTLLQSQKQHPPFSFFNMIFISEEDCNNPDILNHEFAHVKDKHTWDIILLQLLKAIHWFNPFLWLYEHNIKKTHEYIADNYALQYTRKKDYSYILLGQARPIFQVPITSTFHSLTKKRITMIFRKKSKVYAYVFYPIALLIVLQLSSFLLASCQQSAKAEEALKVDKVEYLTQIDTITTFDPVTYKESVEIVKNELEIHSKVKSKPILKACENAGDEAAQRLCSNTKLIETIMETIEFPKGQKFDGKVILKFLIDNHGYMSKPEIVKSLSPDYDKEVLRTFKTLKSSLEWVPAQVEGKVVGFYYTLPIIFKFE